MRSVARKRSARVDIPIEIERGHLEDLETQFNSLKGDERASKLFSTIRFCGNQGIPLPEWVLQAFFEATNAWFSLRAGTLDEAFGTSPITKRRLAQRRRNRLLGMQAWLHVTECKKKGTAIEWETLALKLGSSKTVLQDLCKAITARKID